MYLKASKFSIHMNFLGELKHPCRHDAQNDSEVRKITHTFSIKKINISTTIYSFCFVLFCFVFCFFVCFLFFLLSLIERYLFPLFDEAIFRIKKRKKKKKKKKNDLSWPFLPKRYPSLYFSLCNLVIFSREYCRK